MASRLGDPVEACRRKNEKGEDLELHLVGAWKGMHNRVVGVRHNAIPCGAENWTWFLCRKLPCTNDRMWSGAVLIMSTALRVWHNRGSDGVGTPIHRVCFYFRLEVRALSSQRIGSSPTPFQHYDFSSVFCVMRSGRWCRIDQVVGR